MKRQLALTSLTIFLGNILIGCGSSSSGGGGTGSGSGGSATLVASSSSPSNGNGTLSVSSVVYEDSGLSGVKRIKTTATVGSMKHLVQVYITESSGAIYSASHSWGDDADASSSCAASCENEASCNGAVTHDSNTHKITITNADMTGSFPGTCSSTLTGEINYKVQ